VQCVWYPTIFVLQPTSLEPTKESYVAVLCLGFPFFSILALGSCFQHLTHSFPKKISVPQVLTKHIGQGLKTETSGATTMEQGIDLVSADQDEFMNLSIDSGL